MTYLYTESERELAILNNTPGKIYFEHQTVAQISNMPPLENVKNINPFGIVPVYVNLQRNGLAGELVRQYSPQIESAAAEFGISADLLKAVIYTERAKGWYDNYIPNPSTVGLGNINAKWEALIPGSDVDNIADNIRLSAALLAQISSRLDNPYPEDIYSLYNSLAHDKTYENAQTKSTPYFLKEAMEARAWELNEWHLTEQNYVLDVKLTELGYESWAKVAHGHASIDNVDSFIWDSFVFQSGDLHKSVDRFDTFVRHILDKWDGNLTEATKDIFGADSVAETEDYYIDSINIINANEELGGVLSDMRSVKAATGSNGESFSLVKSNTTTVVEGVDYSLLSIMKSLVATGNATAKFVSDQVGIGTEWYTNVTSQQIIATWLAENIADILDGEMSADEALISLAKHAGELVLSNFTGAVVVSVLDAQETLASVFEELGSGGAYATEYAAGVQAALGRLVFELVTTDFDTEQATNAAISTLSASIASTFVAEQDWFAKGTAGNAAASAAASTAIIGIINSGDFDSGDWAQLGIQVGLAAGAAYAGTAIGAAVGLAPVPVVGVDPVTIVATAIISLIGGKILGGLFGGGKKFGAGEFDTKQNLLDSIYQVQTITVDGQQVPALVAVHPLGATILASGTNIGYIVGNVGADVLVGTEAIQTIVGNGGADYLEGRGGDDNLLGGDGNDHLNGGDGKDILQGDAGDDIIFGEDGDDIVIAGTGNDFAQLGSGDDVANAGEGRDYILAGGGADAVTGDAGDDMLDGGYGNDTLIGGAGADLILGNLDHDDIYGDEGNDTLFGDAGNDEVYGGVGNDFIDGNEGTDILHGDNGADILIGGEDDDLLDGGLGDDELMGGTGNDVILGGMDDDYLNGNEGNDTLRGGYGNDILIGGLGEDSYEGGEGNDIYAIGNDPAELNAIINESGNAADQDVLLFSWLDGVNSSSLLQFQKDADDLKISYNGQLLTTVNDQFVAGYGVEAVELANGHRIDLNAISYDAVTNLGAFSVDTVNGGLAGAQVQAREEFIEHNLRAKEDYWNATFLDRLSQLAYDEQLGDNTVLRYYDGTEVEAFFRSRGKFGGKYTVFKLSQPGNIDGTEFREEYVIQNAAQQAAASSFGNDKTSMAGPYETLFNGAQVIYSTFSGKNIQDIVVNGQVVSTKVAGETIVYAAGATVHGASYAQRVTAGTSHVVDVALKEYGGDMLVGAYWNETLNGKSGDDVLIGNDGNDSILGGDGEDWLFGGDGADTVLGGNQDDVAFGGGGNDWLHGGGGNDAILGSDGNDSIYGDIGDDWLDAGDGNDMVEGGDHHDIIFGGEGSDTLYGGNGNDTLHGNGGGDSLWGGAGDDVLYSYDGQDTLIGGDGEDFQSGIGLDLVSYYDSTAAVSVNLATNINAGGFAEGDILYDIDVVDGSQYHDTIVGAQFNEAFRGWEGNDSLVGGDGNDTLNGGAGADTLDGGAGVDVADYAFSPTWVRIDLTNPSNNTGEALGDIFVNVEWIQGSQYGDILIGDAGNNALGGLAGNDSLSGGDGNDSLMGHSGVDTLNGGNGSDTADYSLAAASVYVDLQANVGYAGEANGDSLISIENLQGSSHRDSLHGGAFDGYIHGGDGDDQILSRAGNHILDGGAGEGDEINYYYSNLAGVTVNLATQTVSGGHATGDSITNFEYAVGSNTMADTLIGSNGANQLIGYGGADSLVGADGDDTLIGGTGADTLDGGNGIDTASYYLSSAWVNVNLALGTVQANGEAAGDIVINVENLIGSAYGDILAGTAQANLLNGLAGNDSISGGDGDDTIIGGAGADTLNGGNGFDIADYSTSSAAIRSDWLTPASGSGDAAGDTYIGIERLIATSYNDTIIGNASANEFRGGAGNDSLSGGDGNDTLMGGIGADTLIGGNGLDTLSYAEAAGSIYVDLQSGLGYAGEANGDSLSGLEHVIGSSMRDSIHGGASDGHLFGGDGNDQMLSRAGNHTLDGGAGDGDEINYYYSTSSGVTINLEAQTVSGGHATGDIIVNFEYAVGSHTMGDILIGSTGNNQLLGYGGADSLTGAAGNDTLDGGTGNDTLAGGDNDDLLIGGDGNDYFYFASNSGRDEIQNFQGAGQTSGDWLHFASNTGLTTAAEVQAVTTYDFATETATITLSAGNVITVRGVTTAFVADDFYFA